MADTQPVLSASQIVNYMECNRYWGFASILKLPTKQYDAAGAGTRVHKILELYLDRGIAREIDPLETWQGSGKTVYKVGRLAQAMSKSLPERGTVPKANLESHFTISPDGIKIQGYRDLIAYGKVTDHKTTSDIKQWAKSDLSVDVQAIVYAVSMFAEDMADSQVDCVWNYGQTKGAAHTRQVEHTFSEDGAFSALHEIVLPPAREMIAHRKSLPVTIEGVHSLGKNLKRCETKGGCPFRESCSRTIKERYVGIMSKNPALEKLRALREAGKFPAETLVAGGKVVGPILLSTVDGKVVLSIDGGGEPTKVSTEGAVPGQTYVEAGLTGEPPQGGIVVEEPIPFDTTPTTNSFEVASAKPTRKRRTKINPEDYTPPEPTPTQSDVPSSVTLVPGITLYIGCEPTKADVTYLDDLIPFVAREVESAISLPHWSLAEYGTGKGLLAAGLKEHLLNLKFTGNLVVRFPHADESRAVISTLVHLASEVVVGRV